MNKEDRLDELTEQIVQTGNYLAGGERFTFDDVREQLDTKEGREALVTGLKCEADCFNIAMYYDDDEYSEDRQKMNEAFELADQIQSLDNDREIE